MSPLATVGSNPTLSAEVEKRVLLLQFPRGGGIEPKTPDIFSVLTQSIHAMECELTKLAAKSADIIITPDVSHIGTFGFHKGEKAISQGYKATQTILPELQEKIRCP